MKNNIYSFDYLNNRVNYDELKTLQTMMKVIEQSEEENSIENVDTESGQSSSGIAATRYNKEQKTFLNQKKNDMNKNYNENETSMLKEQIYNIIRNLSIEDYSKLQAEGISVENYDIQLLYSTLKKIKESSKNEKDKNSADLTDDINNAIHLAMSVGPLTDSSKSYLIKNEIEPTIENTYKAQFIQSSNTNEINEVSASWEQMEADIIGKLKDYGMEASDENMEASKWLLKNDISLTKENIIYKKELDHLDTPFNKDEIIDKIFEQIKTGGVPEDASLVDRDIYLQELIYDIGRINEQDVDAVINEQEELNIQNLIKVQKRELEKEALESKEEGQEFINDVIAKRRIEEIRLKMSYEAAKTLRDNGINIETESLEKLVKELRVIEENYYKEMLKNTGMDPSREDISILQDTIAQVDRLKQLPNYILGMTLSTRKIESIHTLVEQGNHLSLELAKANQTYEALMTRPSGEYGDSISRAFANMESLMQELGIENNDVNHSAMRILAYNNMEINDVNMGLMKSYHAQMDYLMNNLTPNITLHLVKNNMNPLNIPIYELNKEIASLKEELGSSIEEKYSEFLWKLDKNEEITKEQRKSYIGIYRLLYNIDKTDGAALGATIKAGNEITLNNLLTAANTRVKGHMDENIDHHYGLSEDIKLNKEKIVDQVNSAFSSSFANEEQVESFEYHHLLLKEVLEELTPEEIIHLNNEKLLDMNLEELHSMIQPMRKEASIDQEYHNRQKIEQYKQALQDPDQAISLLKQFNIPATINNIMMAHSIFNEDKGMYRRLNHLHSKRDNINIIDYVKKEGTLSDINIDEASINKHYEDTTKEIESLLDEAIQFEDINNEDFKEILDIRKLNNFMNLLASKKFYQIPIAHDGNITNINLTVVNNGNELSHTSISLLNHPLGRIHISYDIKQDYFSGLILCDSQKTLDILKEQESKFIETIKSQNMNYKQMDFALDISGNNITHRIEKEPEGLKNLDGNKINDSNLFEVAKQFIVIVNSIH